MTGKQLSPTKHSSGNEFRDCLDYIESYWDKIVRKPERRKINRQIVDIPHAYVVPNHKKFNYIFYWDTHFIFQGLIGTKRAWIMQAMVENFAHLFEKYHVIPNFNAQAAMGRSQPPFLTSMIFHAYEGMLASVNTLYKARRALFRVTGQGSYEKLWLSKMIGIAKREYTHVWIDEQKLYHHSIDALGLGRYGDRDLGYAHSSELESGWDFTSRFYNRCNEFLPVDLNVFLYKYELDFAKAAEILGKRDEKDTWTKRAHRRKALIQKYMWNPKEGFFFDYNYVYKRQSLFRSLAGFTPLWTGIASKDQSKKMVKKLPLFETDHGLTITDKESLAPDVDLSVIPVRYHPAIAEVLKPKQWDHPHIWPPLEYLTVMGLLHYGFTKDARRIMEKSVRTHAALFRKYGTFFEKIDGLMGDKPADFHYPTQAGFGWTNAIFYRYIKLLDTI